VVELPTGRDRHLVSEDEGCLSLPGAYSELARPDAAICRGLDHNGRPVEIHGSGLLARCLQHETDHLGGTVFGDRLSGRRRKQLYADHERVAYRYPDDWPVSPKGEFDPAKEA
jgi:peptide deformylase